MKLHCIVLGREHKRSPGPPLFASPKYGFGKEFARTKKALWMGRPSPHREEIFTVSGRRHGVPKLEFRRVLVLLPPPPPPPPPPGEEG